MSVPLYSYTGLRTRYGQATNNNTTAHLDKGMDIINDIYAQICNEQDWAFLEKLNTSFTTVDGQQFYDLPQSAETLKSISVDLSTTRYPMDEVSSWQDWEYLNMATSWESSFPERYFIYDNQVGIWPTPSADSNTIRLVYTKRPTRLTLADYTTGTISAIANGGTTVTGSGTSWTSKMEGSAIIIDDSFNANTGDGRLYIIDSVTNGTTLELTRPYEGETISGGTANYTIGQIPLIPQKYCPMLVHYAAYEWWSTQDNGANRAARYQQMFEDAKNQMIEDEGTRGSSVIVEPLNKKHIVNPNFYY